MSFFESISKKSKLKAAIKQTAEARSNSGHIADQLFKKVYQDYAEVVANEPLIAEALYNWGLALLHQARTKSREAAANLYQDAIAKFSFCLTVEPAYLGAALDGGVAYMELARVKSVGPHDSLYGMAKNYFEKANAIQAGSASYNLACIYGLRGEKEACLNALEISKGKGYLPVIADILADPDLDGVKHLDWFVDFMESLNKKPAAAEVNEPISTVVASDEKTEAVVDDAASDEKTEVAADEAERNPFAAAAVARVNEKANADDNHAEDETEAAVDESEAVAENKTEADEDAPVTEKNEADGSSIEDVK
ncbi:MAG: TPR end-of-group domain-containing protein [Methylobacter sp.]